MARYTPTEADVIAQYRKLGRPVPPDLRPAPRPALPSLQVRYPEEAAQQQLWTVAAAHGWVPNMTWNPTGRYAGLGCEFVRGTTLLYVQVLREGTPVTADQQCWLDALRATGKVEVLVCDVTALDTVLARLQEDAALCR